MYYVKSIIYEASHCAASHSSLTSEFLSPVEKYAGGYLKFEVPDVKKDGHSTFYAFMLDVTFVLACVS
jgi:hypothetical protein